MKIACTLFEFIAMLKDLVVIARELFDIGLHHLM